MIIYEVNKDNRTVTAKIEDTKFDVVKYIGKRGVNFSVKEILMPKKIVSVVTCDPRDEFDAEVGKAIARKRVIRKYYKNFDHRLNIIRKAYCKDLDKIGMSWGNVDKYLEK